MRGGSCGSGASRGIRSIIFSAKEVFCALSCSMLALCCVGSNCLETSMYWFSSTFLTTR